MTQSRRKLFFAALLLAHAPILFLSLNKKQNDHRTTTQPLASASKPIEQPQRSKPQPNPTFVEKSRFVAQQFESKQLLDELLEDLLYNTNEENQKLAAQLRNHLRLNPAALETVANTLLDPNTSIRAFANLAMIVGSLEGEAAEDLLLNVYHQFENDPDRFQWAIYAMGTWKQNPAKDDRFSFDERGPMVLQTIEGLATPVFHKIKNPAIYDALVHKIHHSDLDVRLASSLVLRHNLHHPAAYSSFMTQLNDEPSVGNKTIIAEALARQLPKLSSFDQAKTIDDLLYQASFPEAQGLRMKILHPLQAANLTPAQQAQLQTMALQDAEPAIRRFALNVISAQNQTAAEPSPLLLDVAHNDPDSNTRAVAVDLLQQHPSPIRPRQLIPILQNDDAWNVRHSTVEALSELPPDPEAASNALIAVKEAALNDPDPKVSEFALSVLHGLGR